MAGKSTINITFKLDGDSKGFKDLAKDADGLKVVMTSAITEAEKLKTSIVNWSQSVQALNSVSNAMGQLNNSLQTITADSNAFGKAMAAANTMAGKGGEEFTKLKSSVADLAKEVPVARDELANGLYQVISNGVPEDNWLTFLEASAKSSVGGIADLGNAVTVTSTIIKNYGLAWEDAADIQDKIQLTAKNGVTSFEQLAGALPAVAGSASQLGVSIDELMAIFATCTGVTGNTSEVSTQLAAVLNALIKPSSEAAKAAEQMGIKFDAAAVKEAGGLDNFLKSVDTAINEYSARTGELSETIYGNLFGSSRALRLLTSLTGEQADDFTKNIGLMVDSAGTMDEAYDTMSNTASAHAQVLKNLIGSYTDLLTPVTNAIQPFASMAMQVGQMTLGLTTLVKSMGTAQKGLTALGTAAKIAVSAITVFTTAEGRASVATNGWSTAAKMAAASTTALKVAIKGLMIATGVGVAIAAVTTIIEHFISSSKEATEEIKEVNTAEEEQKRAMAEAQASINSDIATLDKYIASNEDASKTIADLKEKYGPYISQCKTAAQVKEQLIKYTEQYVKQLGLEAKAVALSQQLADAQVDKMNAETEERKLMAAAMGDFKKIDQDAWKKANDGVTEADERITQYNKDLAFVTDQLKQANAQFDKQGKTAPQSTEQTTNAIKKQSSAVKANESEYKKLGDRMAEVKENMIGKSGEELEGLQKEYQGLKTQREEMEKTMALAEKPISLNSLQDYEAELSYYNKMRQMATKEELAEWDAKIAATEKAKKAFEEADFTPKALEDIKTYQDVEDELEKLDAEIDKAFGDAKIALMAHKKDVEALGKTYKQQEADIEVALLGPLDTYDKIETAIANVDNKIKNASLSEIKALQDEKKQLESLRDSFDAMGRLSDYQSEMGGIMSGSNAEIKISAKMIGFDAIQEKIKDLESMLAMPDLPDELRPQIESLIDEYEKLAKKSVDTFDIMRQGWNTVEGISSGITGITDALQGNGTAWEKTMAVIDSALKIYDGFTQVVGIINTIIGLTQHHGEEAVTEGTEVLAGATEQVAASAAKAVAMGIETAAMEEATQANLEYAASEIFAAHAYIPFAGVTLATGFVEEMMEAMATLKIPAFAEGGIAYGPTLGLFGEYSDAATNPEVVAPLDRLRSMLKDENSGVGKVRFQIEGRTLVGILDKENRHSSRT